MERLGQVAEKPRAASFYRSRWAAVSVEARTFLGRLSILI